MVATKFRKVLRQEMQHWRSDGLIDQELYDRLATRYQFSMLETEAGNSFIAILMGLGFVLIGLGILSLVAANWQYLNKFTRIAVLLVALFGINISGFYLWQQEALPKQRLGQGLLLLGAIVFGADIAILSQLFQISGDVFILFMGWAIGVLLIAYGLGLPALGVMAIGLLGCGYWGAAMAGLESRTIAPAWAKFLFDYMPIVSAGLFIPLAYRCRSPLIWLLGAIAWLSAFQFAATNYTFVGGGVDRPAVILGCSLPTLLLWGYGRWQAEQQRAVYTQRFAHLSQRLAVFSSGLTCFVLSLNFFIPNILRLNSENRQFVDSWPPERWLFLFLAVGLWTYLLRHRWGSRADRLMLILGSAIAGILTLASVTHHSNWLPSIFFLGLAAITLFCIRAGLEDADRGAFYFGWLLLATRILTWFTFTQTDLIVKSLLFMLCGLATIALGWWFERRLQQAT